VYDSEPIRHPDDIPDAPDEAGPWLALLAASTVAWVVFVLLEWRLLVDGTFVWATVRSLSTLILAPLAAAALLQDTRALGIDGVEVGPLKWAYAAVALLFPPVGGLYLCHRLVLVGRGGQSVG
jgi:TRAP-type C4-dicarboxylate transport system permease large subunit